jgi:hypothetical protein
MQSQQNKPFQLVPGSHLKARMHNPMQVLVDALKTYFCSNRLLPLPAKITQYECKLNIG